MNDQVTLTKISAPGLTIRINGTLVAPIRVGSPVTLWVCRRLDTAGLFQSSPVEQLTSNGFRTRNSEYRVEGQLTGTAFSPLTQDGTVAKAAWKRLRNLKRERQPTNGHS